jgi:xanthosine utilization system XapX-like protein
MRSAQFIYFFCIIPLIGIFALLKGVSFTPPYKELLLIADDLTTQTLPAHRYWLNESLLYPAIMSILDVDNVYKYLIAIVAIVGIQLTYQIYLINRHFHNSHTINLYFISSGCLVTVFYWLGYADPTSFLLGTVCAVCMGSNLKKQELNSSRLIFIISAVATLAHHQVAFFVIIISAILHISHANKYRVFAAFAGWLIGFCLLKAYFLYFMFEGISRLEYLLEYNVVGSLGDRIPQDALLFFAGIFGGGTVFIVNSVIASTSSPLRNQGTLARLSISIFIAMALGMLVLDTTRILTVLLWPIIIFILSKSEQRYSIRNATLVALTIAMLISPNHYWGHEFYQMPLNNDAYTAAGDIFRKANGWTP